jgi:hypothetical protein
VARLPPSWPGKITPAFSDAAALRVGAFLNLRLVKWLAAHRANMQHGGVSIPMPNDGAERAGMVRGGRVRG